MTGLKQEQELWHHDPANIGSTLNKYTVVNLVHKVAENSVREKPGLIAKGFRKAGIFPWNPLSPNMKRMEPSQVYATADSINPPSSQENNATSTDGPSTSVCIEDTKSSSFSGSRNCLEEIHNNGNRPVEHIVKDRQVDEAQSSKSSYTDGYNEEVRTQEKLSTAGNSASSAFPPCPLPPCTPRFLAKFELLLSEEQVDYCNKVFAAGEMPDNSVYKAWETLKIASLPESERQAMEEVNNYDLSMFFNLLFSCSIQPHSKGYQILE